TKIGTVSPLFSAYAIKGQVKEKSRWFLPLSDLTKKFKICVGGLDPSVDLEDLRQTFSQYGETTSMRIPDGKGFGFVEFANRSNVEEALLKLHRTIIGKQTVYLSWCKNPANNKQFL
ncbi:hypothetical protein IFM89_024814, partial [Coptis chinensis]